MPYIRISLMEPKAGQEQRVIELLDEMIRFYEEQPGYLEGYRLQPVDRARHVGRFGVWESDEVAHHAAQHERDMALMSQLRMFIEEDSHEEFSFEGIPAHPHPPESATPSQSSTS